MESCRGPLNLILVIQEVELAIVWQKHYYVNPSDAKPDAEIRRIQLRGDN